MTSIRDYTPFGSELFANKIYCIYIGLALIFLSNIVGHFAPPFSIVVTPVLLPVIIGVVNYSCYKGNYYLAILYGFGLLLLNDILIRFFAGGTHDNEGMMWIFGFSLLAFLLSILAMIISAFKIKTANTRKNEGKSVLAKIIFIVGVATVVAFFHYKVLSKI